MNRFFTYIFDKAYTYSVQMEPSACFEYLNEKCTIKDKEQKEAKRLTFMRYPFEILDSNEKLFKVGFGGCGKGAVLKGQVKKNNEGSKIEVRIFPRCWLEVTFFFLVFSLILFRSNIKMLMMSYLLILLNVFWNWLEGRMYLKLMDEIVKDAQVKD